MPLFFISVGVASATALLFAGFESALQLAISVATKLEPGPPHGDQFDALKKRAYTPALSIALGFGFLTEAILVATLQPSP